jgi:hypothetical protein
VRRASGGADGTRGAADTSDAPGSGAEYVLNGMAELHWEIVRVSDDVVVEAIPKTGDDDDDSRPLAEARLAVWNLPRYRDYRDPAPQRPPGATTAMEAVKRLILDCMGDGHVLDIRARTIEKWHKDPNCNIEAEAIGVRECRRAIHRRLSESLAIIDATLAAAEGSDHEQR